jgi:hypothetical protein
MATSHASLKLDPLDTIQSHTHCLHDGANCLTIMLTTSDSRTYQPHTLWLGGSYWQLADMIGALNAALREAGEEAGLIGEVDADEQPTDACAATFGEEAL